MRKENSEQLKTRTEYAFRLNVCTRTIDRLIDQGLPHLRVGAKSIRIDPLTADKWLTQTYGTTRAAA
jgi:hypothetical protein